MLVRRVPDITLAAMTKGDGSGWWNLIEHFLVDIVVAPTDFKILHHPVFDRKYGFDRAADSLPLPRSVRMYQEEVLLGAFSLIPYSQAARLISFAPSDRHIFIVLFLIALLELVDSQQLLTWVIDRRKDSTFRTFTARTRRERKWPTLDATSSTRRATSPPTSSLKLSRTLSLSSGTRSTCACCEKPKRDIPALVASGKNFSFCSTWYVHLRWKNCNTC